MIDTIVLVLKQSMFTIADHNKFSPSTEGLYNASYRLGSRSNMVCKQNPTPNELKQGIYKPRLTITKRINKLRNFEIMLKIEFSAPKLLFGNNFDELEDSDFGKVVGILQAKLKDMGVWVWEHNLVNAPVSNIHYSKNIPLTDYSIPYTYLEKLSRANINQHLDVNQTDFRNEGHSVKYRANSFEVVFYDKLKDLVKAKVSEKRAEEKDNQIQLNLLDDVTFKKPFEVLRMEVRLNKKQKLIQILKKIGFEEEPTFQALFKKDIAQKILLHYLSEIEAGFPAILRYESEPKDFMSEFVINNPQVGLKKALQMFGLKVLFDTLGVREFREITKQYGRENWYRLNKELKGFAYPEKPDSFTFLRNAVTEFKPLKMFDFKAKAVNN